MTKIDKGVPSSSSIPLGICASPTVRNRGAIAWSKDDLVAIGCNTDVLVIDPNTLTLLQILEFHKSSVNRVLFNPTSRDLKPEKSTGHDHIDLISGDLASTIALWSLQKSNPVHTFLPPENRILLQMKFFTTGPDTVKSSKLALLYGGNYLILFDIYSLLHQTFTLDDPNEFHDFDLNPFNENVAIEFGFICGNDVIGIAHFDPIKSTNDRIQLSTKISLSSFNNRESTPTTMTMTSTTSSSSLAGESGGDHQHHHQQKMKKSASGNIRKLVGDLVGGGGENSTSSNLGLSSYDPNYPNSSIHFHPNIRDSVVVGTRDCIYLVNTQFRTVLTKYTGIEKHQSIFTILPISSRPYIYSLHETGIISLRKFSFTGTHNITLNLDQVCQSDNPRFTKKSQVLGATLDPNSEARIIINCMDGRLIMYELYQKTGKDNLNELRENLGLVQKILPTPISPKSNYNPGLIFAQAYPGSTSPSPEKFCKNSEDSAANDDNHHNRELNQLIKSSILQQEGYELLQFRLKKISCPMGTLTCIKVSPNGNFIVGGTNNGFLLVIIFDQDRRAQILKKFSVHGNNAIIGIEFISDKEVLSYANISFSANPKNELILTEIETGSQLILKQDSPSHIGSLKVSPLKQYFIIIFKNGMSPSELWDIGRKQLIKTLPTKLPAISCVQWKENGSESREETQEVFYMTDLATLLFTFRVEGNRFSNATCTKLDVQGNFGIPISLFTTNNLVFRSDSSGSLVIYNTDKKTASTAISLGRGPLYKIDHQCEYFIAMFSDLVNIYDINSMKKIHTETIKANDIAIMEKTNTIAYISKTGSLRFLPLDISKYPGISKYQFKLSNYPIFQSSKEKALKLFKFLSKLDQSQENSCCDENEIDKLFKEFGMYEEAEFLSIFLKSVTTTAATSTFPDENVKPSVSSILCDKEGDLYNEILYKTCLSAWVSNFGNRELVARTLIFSGEMEKAAEILLDCEPTDPKAYLLNGLMSSIVMGHTNLAESTKAVLKIVSTNLIASGEFDEGLELLCILSKHTECCKYLEGSNNWQKALLIARSMPIKEATEVLIKYANYLNSNRIILKSAKIFALLNKASRVIEVLFGSRRRELAYITLLLAEKSSQSAEIAIADHIKLAIKLDFSRFLFENGLISEALEFCSKIGPGAEDLKCEFEILSS